MIWSSVFLLTAFVASARSEYTVDCNEGACVVKGKSSDTPYVVHGDILVDEATSRNAVLDPKMRWPNKTVPYLFHENLTDDEKTMIEQAMANISARSCVQFVPRTSEDYLLISKEDSGCYANVGYDPNTDGYTRLNLQNPGCFYSYIIQHELLHVLGLYHEQSRPDRDKYVNIYWFNIEPKNAYNFNKLTKSQATTYNIPYDYKSVMHYGNYDFAITPYFPTITSKTNFNLPLGNKVEPTKRDMLKIQKMYSC